MTAVLASTHYRFTPCEPCAGTGFQSRIEADDRFKNGQARIVFSCRACEGRGLNKIALDDRQDGAQSAPAE